MALDDASMRHLVDCFIVSRSRSGGATAKELAAALGVTPNYARSLLANESVSTRHRMAATSHSADTARHRWLSVVLPSVQQSLEAGEEFARVAAAYRRSLVESSTADTMEAPSQLLERAEHALFMGDLEGARRAFRSLGRPRDRLPKKIRRAYSTRFSIASSNEAMQSGQFGRAVKIAAQFMNHDLSLEQRLELTATYGAALRMNPAKLRASVEVYTDGIRLAEEAGTVGRARLRHLLTARSAPLAALGHAGAAIHDLHRAVALAPDEFSDVESRLCRVRAFYIAGDLGSAEQHWPEFLPSDAPLWLARWHERFRLAFFPARDDADAWNARAIRVWNDNKDHGFQRRLIAAMVLRSPHARNDAWDRETWKQLEDATASVARDSLFLAT